ncbi:MAG: hypothetical protein NVS9B10_19590 [Nevskia sp.]
MLGLGGLLFGTASAAEPGAAALLAKHAALAPALDDNPFKRPLHLESNQTGSRLRGEIHAVVEHPFAAVDEALDGPKHWCEVLILQINSKYCHIDGSGEAARLTLDVGRKDDPADARGYRLVFAYRVIETSPDYFAVRLSAEQGPLNTSDYRIDLEAVALPGRRTFLHLSYAYTYGLAGRLAMKAYLLTGGRGKVGFTNTGTAADGQPLYIDGVRGVIERNTMRYYLAIDAWLATRAAPPGERLQRALSAWFDATERYPRQLHELDRAAYLQAKRRQAADSGIP